MGPYSGENVLGSDNMVVYKVTNMTSHVAGFDVGSSIRHLASGREILYNLSNAHFSVNILFNGIQSIVWSVIYARVL